MTSRQTRASQITLIYRVFDRSNLEIIGTDQRDVIDVSKEKPVISKTPVLRTLSSGQNGTPRGRAEAKEKSRVFLFTRLVARLDRS